MKKTVIALILASLFITPAFAKRAPAPAVKPVIYQGVRFEAPARHMGYIEAYASDTGEKIWEKQVYKVDFNPLMEKDVQCIFITSLSVDKDTLAVIDEKGRRFKVPLPKFILKEKR